MPTATTKEKVKVIDTDIKHIMTAEEVENQTSKEIIEEQQQKQPKPAEEQKEEVRVHRKGLPYAYNLNMVQDVIHTDDYKVTDLFMRDEDGNVLWTTVYVTLYPGRQSFPLYSNNAEFMYVIHTGKVWFTIKEIGQIFHKGDRIIVKRGNKHKLFNNKEDEPCIYSIDYQGLLDLRKILKPVDPEI